MPQEPRLIGELLSELLPKYLDSQTTEISGITQKKRPRALASNKRLCTPTTESTLQSARVLNHWM